MNPVVEEFCQRAADYVALVNNRPHAESVPYDVAVARSKDAVDDTLRVDDRQTLLDNIVALKEKVLKLEHDREHWMLEAQLIQIKTERAAAAAMTAKKSAEEESEGKGVRGGKREEEDTGEGGGAGNSLGGLETSDDVILDADADEADASKCREDVIKDHYMARIQELTSQLQVADSKSLHFYTDSMTLQVPSSIRIREVDN